jgi:hypothetical protein
MRCLTCDCFTDNPKFCTRSCAATYNNKAHPKRKVASYKRRLCPQCETNMINYRTEVCSDCRRLNEENRIKSMTLQEAINESGVRASKYNTVRHHARQAASVYEQKCGVCNYDVTVQVCHVKAIKDFELTETLEVINSLDNLALLCPNHHWELDHGYISVSMIKTL